VRLRRGGRSVATLQDEVLAAGRHGLAWDGRLQGSRQPDGVYGVGVHAYTSFGRRSLYGRLVLDTAGPRVVIRSARRVSGATRIRVALNEAARLTIWYGRVRWNDGTSIAVWRDAGVRRIWRRVFSRVVRVQGRDVAGNVGPAVVARVRAG
jgi:hypothetical protein